MRATFNYHLIQHNLKTMDDLLQIYERLQSRITFDEFKEKVQEKIDLMGGLCDEKTASKLVAHDLGILDLIKIDEISRDQKNVSFMGKVTQLNETHEFSRDDGSIGRVAILSFRTRLDRYEWYYGMNWLTWLRSTKYL